VAVKTPIYLDHNATTPLDPRVLEVLQRSQRDHFGNPSSDGHALGWAAAKLVKDARQEVATLLGVEPAEIIFTSGATESNNLAILGVARSLESRGKHLVLSCLEHEAVQEPARALERQGWDLTIVACDELGLVDPGQVEAALRPDSVLVSIIAGQNEVGTIQPLAEIGRICQDRGVILHSDAAQAAGRIPLPVRDMGLGSVSLSAHKMYGPKGMGALFLSRKNPRVRPQPIQFGGGQERGLRSGTLNAPAIAAFGEACRIVREEREAEGERLTRLAQRFHHGLSSQLPDVLLNGCPRRRLPGCLNFSFPGVDGAALSSRLTSLAVSSGSACSSSDGQPSRILQMLGRDEALARSSLRIGLGRGTTEEEVDFATGKIIEVVTALS
jgi:cysteine desulfurase